MGTEGRNHTEKQFGYEWSIYREIIPLHEEQFLDWIRPVRPESFRGKRFLDAGCGIGRNSLWPLRAGAASARAIDFDQRTVAIARFNLKDFPHCEVLYQSIYDLDARAEFDIVFCIGVLQHLADPRRAVENLTRALKPGGTLILWVYAHEGNEGYLSWLQPLRRLVTSRLHHRLVQGLAMLMTFLLHFYLLLPHRNKYLRLLRKRSFRHAEAMVFDQLLPAIAHYWRRDEVLALVAGLPLRVTHLTHTNGMSWTLVAEKPPAP
jgi:SAM-dependent methyltransferase